MSSVLRNILRNSSTRILVLIFGFLLLLTGYFIIYGYYSQLNIYEEKELTKLKSIARTLALQIDGEAHKLLLEKYDQRDAIKDNKQDPVYYDLHKALKQAKEVNILETTIYTMVYDSAENRVFFGVSTADPPFYRHEYEHFPQALIDNYETGGVIPPYHDENGTWLSAFVPIKDFHGKVIAVLQVDEQFDSFIMEANKAILKSTLLSIAIIIMVGFVLLKSIRTILLREEAMTKKIIESKKIIEQKNRDITDSIHYAKKIQDAILPSFENINRLLPESFILYLPRDIVSGDFYWFTELNGKALLAAVDCTGHGVPGAFMSMIGNTLLNEIVNQKNIIRPAAILNQLDAGINKALNQRNDGSQTRDGMDMALCCFDLENNLIQYSGAFRPLLHIRNDEVMEIKGDKYPIGGGMNEDKPPFTDNEIQINKGDTFYIFSDGFPDQFGGLKGKKYMTRRFKDLLQGNQHLDMKAQQELLKKHFHDWKNTQEQVDDVLVIGVKV